MKTSLSLSLCVCILIGASLAWCSPANAFQNQIFTEGFDGGTGGRLDETTEDLSGTTWSANGFATDNGILNVGPANLEGAATLGITLVADTIYTVEIDVTSNAAEWFGLGFSENSPILEQDAAGMALTSALPNSPQSRFAQSGGRAWMLYRPGDPVDIQVEIFGGSSTVNVIPDTGTNFSGAAVQRTLAVVLNTDSAGATADFLIDGVSQSNGPQPLFEDAAGAVPLTDLTLLDNVGFTWEGQSPGGVAGAITIDNFSVSDNSTGFLLGDVDGSTAVDFLDIAPFIAILASSGFQAEADIDGSMVVDFLDIAPFIAILAGSP